MSMDEYIRKEDALRVISDVLFETDPDGKEQIAVLKCSHRVRELPSAGRVSRDPHVLDLYGTDLGDAVIILTNNFDSGHAGVTPYPAVLHEVNANFETRKVVLTFEMLWRRPEEDEEDEEEQEEIKDG